MSVYAYVGLSLFIIRWTNVYLVVCVLKKWQKWGRAIWVLSRFGCVTSEMFCPFLKSTFKLIPVVLGDFLFNSALFIHSPYQTGSQPMSGR